MKSSVGVLAVLLFVTTLAMGQQYQPLPFPQAANPALANGAAEESAPAVGVDLPSFLATNQSGAYADRRGKAELGSPFPQAANPALANPAAGESSLSIGHSTADGGSPFPSAANPSRNL
jgi:hypothetical protein